MACPGLEIPSRRREMLWGGLRWHHPTVTHTTTEGPRGQGAAAALLLLLLLLTCLPASGESIRLWETGLLPALNDARWAQRGGLGEAGSHTGRTDGALAHMGVVLPL